MAAEGLRLTVTTFTRQRLKRDATQSGWFRIRWVANSETISWFHRRQFGRLGAPVPLIESF